MRRGRQKTNRHAKGQESRHIDAHIDVWTRDAYGPPAMTNRTSERQIGLRL
jgi:hypothetical protein